MNIDYYVSRGIENAFKWKRDRDYLSFAMNVQSRLTGYIQAVIESDRKPVVKLVLITKAMVHAELAISVLMDNVSDSHISGISVND